jgi:hypothetical protein
MGHQNFQDAECCLNHQVGQDAECCLDHQFGQDGDARYVNCTVLNARLIYTRCINCLGYCLTYTELR